MVFSTLGCGSAERGNGAAWPSTCTVDGFELVVVAAVAARSTKIGADAGAAGVEHG